MKMTIKADSRHAVPTVDKESEAKENESDGSVVIGSNHDTWSEQYVSLVDSHKCVEERGKKN